MPTSLASDTFTGTNGDAWGSTWALGQDNTGSLAQIQSNAGRVTTGSAGGYSGMTSRKVNISNPTDQVWVMKFRWPTGDECYPGIWMRANADILDAQAGYCFELNRPSSNWSVFHTTSYVGTELATAAFTFTSNVWYWVRCGIVGSAIKFKIWADGVSEPGAWAYEGTDTTYAGAGRCGIRVGPGNVGSAKFEVDDFGLDDGFQLQFSGTATLAGSGALTAVGVPRPTSTPGLSGAGVLSTARTPAFAVTAAFTGAGALTSPARTPALPGTGTLAGAGSLSTARTPALTGATAALAGSGALTTARSPSVPGTATLAGAGTLTAVAGTAAVDTAARTGSGTLTATGIPTPGVVVARTGAGQLVVVPVPAIPGTAALAGTGVLAVGVVPGLTATVARTGSGALTTTGVPTPTAVPGLSGAGTLTTTGITGFTSAATLTGAGLLSTTRTPSLPGTATFSAAGTLLASGTPKPAGTATLAGAGALLAVGTPHLPGSAVLAGAGTLSTTVVPRPAALVALAGAGDLTLARTPAVPGSAALNGAGALIVGLSGQGNFRGTARLAVPTRRIRIGPDTYRKVCEMSSCGMMPAQLAADPAFTNLYATIVSVGPAVGSDAWLKLYAGGDLDALIVGVITRDATGAAIGALVVWPDGVAGVYAGTASTATPGAVDSYTVTYVGATTKTVTQPTVTRNAAGAVTTRPAMTVA